MLLSAAISFVRARLDEIAFDSSDMIVAASDDRNLDTTIEKLLPEAVKVVVLASPNQLLAPQYEEEKSIAVAGTATFWPSEANLIKVVYIKSGDSPVYVTDVYPVDSPEALMQNNPYTRGNADCPVVVQSLSSVAHNGYKFDYYSVKGRTTIVLAYITKPEITGTGTTLDPKEVFCPPLLTEAVLNELTAKVLEVYGDQRAQLFHQNVTTYLAL